MAELTLLERRRIEAGVLVPSIRALQAKFGETRVRALAAGPFALVDRDEWPADGAAGSR